MNDIDAFLSRCDRNAGALAPLKQVWRAFNSGLPDGRRGAWSRDRFITALVGAGLSLGEMENVQYVTGLALPGAAWRVTDGRVAMEVA